MRFSPVVRLLAIATLLMVISPADATAGPQLEIFLPGQTEPFSSQQGEVIAWETQWDGSDYVPVTVPTDAQSGVIAIAVGGNHTVALKAEGKVIAWGSNWNGQINVPVAAQSGVVAVAAGGDHTVALKQDGSVIAWGSYGYGETTVPTTAQSGVVAIAAGFYHTVALKEDGSVIAWGANYYGQTTVPSAASSSVVAIAAGSAHTVALKADGSVIAWGDNYLGQTTIPAAAQSGVVAVSAGYYFTVALKADGSVIAWGANGHGQTTVPAKAQSGVVAIAAGHDYTMALKADSSVIAWGIVWNDTNFVAASVPADAQSGVVAIAAGGEHMVALKPVSQSFKVAAGQWTEREFTVRNTGGLDMNLLSASLVGADALRFQIISPTFPCILSPGSSVTLRVRYLPDSLSSDFASLLITSTDPASPHFTIPLSGTGLMTRLEVTDSAGPATSAALGNRVVIWGHAADDTNSLLHDAQGRVVAIAAGGQHTVALNRDGRVISAGVLWNGSALVPVSVPDAAQSGVIAIAAGGSQTLALKPDGSVMAWGWIWKGRAAGFAPTFVPAAAQSGVVAIDADYSHAAVLKKDGRVVEWGTVWNGLPHRSADIPVTVPQAAQSGVVAISVGSAHTVALKEDGSVIAWGSNYFGETSVPAAAKSGVVAIAAGGYHTLALKRDGSVIAWGNNKAWDQAIAPNAVQSGVVAIAASGEARTVVLKEDGKVIAWDGGYLDEITVPASLRSGVLAIASAKGHIAVMVEATGDFGTRQLGSGRDHPIQLSNTGNLPLTITSLSIEGRDADQFQVLGTVPGTLAVKASGPLTLRFAPTRLGSMQATLTITSNDPAIPLYTLDLAGNGSFSLNAIKGGASGSDFSYGPLRLERATGLKLQTVRFTNTTGGKLEGLKLSLSKLGTGVHVYSSSQSKVPGTCEVIYSNPIATGETISFDLVYADPQRRTTEAMQPFIKAEALIVPEPDSPPLAGTLAPLLRVLVTPPGPLLEWSAVPRATYGVEYSDDGGKTWFSAVHRLSTSGRRMIWIDRGQPETKSKPAGVPNKPGGRSYRIRKAS